MKVFSALQLRAADDFTIKNEPISSLDLMERAARKCYNWFHQNISRSNRIAIFCGKGNNGGDGLALARMLHSAGYKVRVFVVNHSSKNSPDFYENRSRLCSLNLEIIDVINASEINLTETEFIVDALIGSGLNKPLKGLLADVVAVLNAHKGVKIAIDLPSGLFADANHENADSHIFKADFTLTFQSPKWSFFFPGFGDFVGEIVVLDIGIAKNYIESTSTRNYYITQQLVDTLKLPRNKFAHKGSFGHVLVVAGSFGKMGAAILASRAALKAGCGLVTAHVPLCGVLPMQSANPEIMVQADCAEKEIEELVADQNYSAIAAGPGIGTSEKTSATLISFLKSQQKAMVLDADALNILSKANAWNCVPEESILTPHLGEFERMIGKTFKGEEVYEMAQKFAIQYHVNLVLKGAHTAIYTSNGSVFFNSTGCNGMATAGSGDVLTGVITSLLAQGYSPEAAAICGVFYHGISGEEAAKEMGNAALTAGDIISYLRIGE